jgi:MFS family permease
MTDVVVERTGRSTGGLLGGGYRLLTVGAVALVTLLAFEALAVTIAMPTVARELDGLGLYALAFAGPLAASVVGMVAAGSWSDGRGPAGPTWTGVGLFVVGLLVAGGAPGMGTLAAGRVLQGLGSGLLSVALYVIVARVYPDRLRPKIFAAFAAAWVVPALIGPAVVGVVVQYAGWRWVFLGVPLLAIPAVTLLRPALRGLGPAPDAAADRGALVRVGWALGAGVSTGLLHLGGQQSGATAAVLIGVAVACLLATVPRLLPAGFLRLAPGLPTVIGLRGLASAAFFGAEVLVPLLLSRERALNPTLVGFVVASAAICWATGSWLQGRLTRPGRRIALLRVGFLMVLVGIGLIALVVYRPVPLAVGALGWGAAGLGMGLAYPTLSVLTLELSAPHEQGRNSSALQLADALFTATVLAFSGALLATGVGPTLGTYLAGFAVSGALAALGFLLAPRSGAPNGGTPEK